MPRILITGANRGIGLEFATQYLRDGWIVDACCRLPEHADALNRLARQSEDIHLHGLDVADWDSVRGLARQMEGVGLDVIVSNAGVYGLRTNSFGNIDYSDWARTLRVNTLGPMYLFEQLVDRLSGSERPRVVAVTSKMGSIEDNSSGGGYVYRTSKAALNMAMRSLAADLRQRDVSVAVIHPGWVRTDMGGPNGLIDTATSVAGMRAVIDRLTIHDSGRFFNYDGAEIPW